MYDLENVFPVKTYEELQTMLNEHYFGNDSSNTHQPAVTTTPKDDEDDDLDFGDIEPAKSEDGAVDDDKVKQLLDTLD